VDVDEEEHEGEADLGGTGCQRLHKWREGVAYTSRTP
jgi:hypothetical protein